jgi:ribonuclease HI
MLERARKKVTLITDGACLGNPGPGGWAALLRFEAHYKELSGAAAHTTNNRMELTAVIEGLRTLREPCDVTIVTDSEYVQRGVTQWMPKWKRNGWRTAAKEPVKNQDLWMALDEQTARHSVRWEWVRGHAGHADNTRADELASQAARSARAR